MPRFKIVLVFVPMVILCTSSGVPAQGNSLCPAVTSEGEGHWPIPETAFTRAEAVKALDSLNEFVRSDEPQADFVAIENHLLFVKGYLFKSYAERGAVDTESFCEFVKDEAYVRH